MSTDIVKVQLPQSWSGTEPMILVYNRTRTRECLIPATEYYAELFNNEAKSFWYAQWNAKKKGYDKFLRQAPWQDW